MALQKMEISTTSSVTLPSSSPSSSSLLGYCWRLGRHETGEDWEWMESLGLSPESLVTASLLATYAPHHTSPSKQAKWMARVIEGVALSVVVVVVIAIAALGPLLIS
jgi:hypothetical protein